MTTISQPCGVQRQYRPQGIDRALVRFGLVLAAWGNSRPQIRAVRSAHYAEQVRRFERLRDQTYQSAPGVIR